MSENASNIPLDDEDILDLTVVAEPGKPAAKDDGPPEMDDADGPVNFGADLDALLDSLGADGTVTPPTAIAKPVAAPIADQTPVDHTVDPDEEMAMPTMSDIDSLLAGLGAEIPAAKAAAPMPEFDGILARAQAAEAEKAGEETAAIPGEPAAPPPVAEPEPAPPVPGDIPATPDPGKPAPIAPVAAAPRVGADVPAAEDPAGEALDLNELDALLDDILATAPEASSPPPAKTAPATPAAALASRSAPEKDAGTDIPLPRKEHAADLIPVPDQAIMPAAGDIAALTERVHHLEESLLGLDEPDELLDEIAALTERVHRLENSGEHAALAGRMQRLEEFVTALEAAKTPDTTPEDMLGAALDAKLESLFAPDSPVMERICAAVRSRFAAGDFNESLEKMAAAAAAKVIREEIAAMMQDSGD